MLPVAFCRTVKIAVGIKSGVAIRALQSGRCNLALCLKNKETDQLNVNVLFTVQENYFFVPLRCAKYARNQNQNQYGVVPYDDFSDFLYLLQ